MPRRPPSVFVGLDLAWSRRNRTGAVTLRAAAGGRLTPHDPGLVTGDEEILRYVEAQDPGPGRLLVVAVDAPLIAPNRPGTGRPVDREMSRLYGRYHAGVYPGNRRNCARPIALARRLVGLGFSLDPWDLRDHLARNPRSLRGRRYALEVYPHAAMVGLFGLGRIVKYKKGPVADRRRGLRRLQRLLHDELPQLEPPVEPLQPENPATLRGKALKGLEDRLDALVCAAMAARFVHRPETCVIPGDIGHGYILVPRPPGSAAGSTPGSTAR